MISDNLAQIRSNITAAAAKAGRDASSIKLVAVSKFVPADRIQEALRCGQTLFGENYLQEAEEKIPLVGADAKWHFIGHLQSNKAKLAAALFDMVETVDRLKIAKALDTHAKQLGKTRITSYNVCYTKLLRFFCRIAQIINQQQSLQSDIQPQLFPHVTYTGLRR